MRCRRPERRHVGFVGCPVSPVSVANVSLADMFPIHEHPAMAATRE